jgi:methyl-accepting chemotaxis protein
LPYQPVSARESKSSAAHSSTKDIAPKSIEVVRCSNEETTKIIKTIDEIVFQTNILALNAAVEAARAGEAGMGFAVVADEVRNRAQKSAQAAKETSAKIEAAMNRSAEGVRVSERVLHGLHSIADQVQDVTGKLQGIVHQVQQMDSMMGEIATASQEQSQGISQVNIATSQMDKVIQSTAASAEESASTASELNGQAEALKQVVKNMLDLVQKTPKKHRAPRSPVPAGKSVANTLVEVRT